MNEMKESYLEVTFRHGRPLAAYLYLPREAGEKVVRSTKAVAGMVVDWGPTGRPIGIELTAPTNVTLATVNEVLGELGLTPLSAADLEPLLAA
jgi:hypothetical protein